MTDFEIWTPARKSWARLCITVADNWRHCTRPNAYRAN